MQIPVARPIFLREVSNRMYGPTSYYFASCTASVITFFLYPIISSFVSFPFFGFNESSFTDLLHWAFIMNLIGMAGSFWGFMIGSFAKNEVSAIQINLICLYIFSFGGGFYANTGANENVFVTAKLQPASNPLLIIGHVVAGGAEANPKGFRNFRPQKSTLKST